VEIGASASQLFGSSSAESVFAVGVSSGASSEQQTALTVVKAQQREINRIRGYKLQLTAAENFRLTEIQGEILKIQEKTSNGTVRPDELEDRTELYKEADRIIGKPVLDYDASEDEVLTEYTSALEALMQPRLDSATQKHVDYLKRIKERLETKLEDSPDNATVLSQFQSVSGAIDKLKPLRLVEQLSKAERREYDEIVDKINDHVGMKLQLNSRDAMRVGQLERSINDMASSLPADPAGQPTSAAVTRAYTRFA
jgi:hypothetical protein